MSAQYIFQCPSCGFEAEAWDDGYPYILDDAGKRHFFYHPGERDVIDRIASRSRWAMGKEGMAFEAEISKHIGHMVDALCADCCNISKVDGPLAASATCSGCGGHHLTEVLNLNGKRCPKCRTGTFPQVPRFGAIS